MKHDGTYSFVKQQFLYSFDKIGLIISNVNSFSHLKTNVMKAITFTTNFLAIILISFGAYAQGSRNSGPFYFTAKDVSIGLYLPKDSNYVFTYPAAPDTQKFQYDGNKMFTRLGEFRLVNERGYFSKDSSFYIIESESKDINNENVLIVLTTDFQNKMATLEFRRPLISHKFTLKNEINKKDGLFDYIN
jgi:hypothetical protein